MSSATLRFDQGAFWVRRWPTPDARTLQASARMRTEGNAHVEGTGRQAVLELALLEAAEEASAPGWDGYDGKPLDPRAWRHASVFLELLPAATPIPEIGATPEGAIALDWWGPGNQIVSAIINGAGRIVYSSRLAGINATGAADLHEEIAPQFYQELQRVLHPR